MIKITTYATALALLLVGCNGVRVSHNNFNNSIYGNWYLKNQKILNSNIKIDVTKKEQFYKNGLLQSTKWFNFKDKSGNSLGEFYITKLFTWQKDNKIIKVKFKRCQTSVTKKLLVGANYYQPLFNKCSTSRATNRITIKRYRIQSNRLLLGREVYYRDR